MVNNSYLWTALSLIAGVVNFETRKRRDHYVGHHWLHHVHRVGGSASGDVVSDNPPQDPCEHFPPDVEPMVCPRRMPGYPYRKDLPDHDTWETNRWGRPDDKWPEELGTPPRTCSFCGSVHPDDAVRLIKEGWEIGPTDKFYKWYLEVPGSTARNEAFIESLGNEEKMDELRALPHHEVLPCVKFYSHHASPEQIKELNSLWVLQNTRGSA